MTYSDPGSNLNPWCGFVPVHQPDASVTLGGRQRVLGPTSWSEDIIRAICHDDGDLASQALKQKHVDVNAKLMGGTNDGEPYDYAGAGFFTWEQMDALTGTLQSSARSELERRRGFLTSSELADIDNNLSHIGIYAPPAFSRVVLGDTGLGLAVRLGRLRVATSFLAVKECDPTMLNNKGETACDVLLKNWINIKELRQRMRDEPGGRNTMIMATRKVHEYELLASCMMGHIQSHSFEPSSITPRSVYTIYQLHNNEERSDERSNEDRKEKILLNHCLSICNRILDGV